MTDQQELTEKLVNLILEHERIQNVNADWNEMTFVFDMADDGVIGNNGFLYESNGSEISLAISMDDELKDTLKAFRRAFSGKNEEMFIKVLIQFNRKTRQLNVGFEFEDEARWKVTPSNFDTIAEELRPNFSED